MNKRKHLRFYTHIETHYGIIKNISYEGALLKAKDEDTFNRLLTEASFELDILGEKVKAKAVLDNINPKEKLVGILIFEKPISKDTLKKAIDLYPRPKHISKEPKLRIETKDLEDFEAHDFVKSVMPLILELMDENTNVDKIYNLLRSNLELQQDILNMSNSAYANKGIEIKDVKSAIIRLGLSRIRDYTIRAISKESLLEYKDKIQELLEFETMLILQTAIFDELCSYACTQRNRFYDFIILSMMDGILIILRYLSKAQNKEDIKQIEDHIKTIIKTPRKVYSYISRIFEKDNFGKDIIGLDKEYFEKIFYGFIDIINAIIIGYNTYIPMYRFNTLKKIEISRQAILSSFPIHMSIIGAKAILENDRKSLYILSNRLSRFGIKSANSFLNACISKANETLKDLGIKKEIYKLSGSLDFKINIEGEEIKGQKETKVEALTDFYALFIDTITKQKRVCIRYEDEYYTMSKIDNLLNYVKDIHSGAFGVIDLKTFEMPTYEDLSFYDHVVIKNIQELKDPSNLIATLKQFEGHLILTLENKTDLESKNPELFKEIIDFTIDFPSYMEDDNFYKDLIHVAKTMLKQDLDIDKDTPIQDKYDLKSVLRLLMG